MPKIKDTARFSALHKAPRVNNSNAAVMERERKAIATLGEEGPMRSSDLAHAIGYSNPTSGATFLRRMVERGRILRTGAYYHLQGQSTAPANLNKRKTKSPDFFDTKTLAGKLRQYIKDHQDEPLTLQKISDAVGYTSSGAASTIISGLLHKQILRRYRAPEDFGFEWRYQYTDEELSGIKTSKLPDDTLVKRHEFKGIHFSHHDNDDCPTVAIKDWSEAEVPVAEAIEFVGEEETPTEEEAYEAAEQIQEEVERVMKEARAIPVDDLMAHANLIEQYAKDFFWATGNTNSRELVIWLKERALAGQK